MLHKSEAGEMQSFAGRFPRQFPVWLKISWTPESSARSVDVPYCYQGTRETTQLSVGILVCFRISCWGRFGGFAYHLRAWVRYA